jgi:carboxymethylenebutenolidase
MKKTSIILFLVFVFATMGKSQDMTCCAMASGGPNATASFASLGADESFARSHLSPRPYVHYSTTGKMVKFPTNDGKEANAYLVKSQKPSNKYLFVFHEWWGLNGHIQKETDKYAETFPDVNIIAIDLYDGKIASKSDEAAQYMQSLKEERARAIVSGAITYAGKDARIATVGWCMGGGWSLQAALMAGKQSIATVIYYGMPEKDVEKLQMLNSDVLGIFAGKEKWINKDIVAEFESNMQKAGKKLTVEMYDAEHAFANPSNPIYDKAAADDAHNKTVAFLRSKF